MDEQEIKPSPQSTAPTRMRLADVSVDLLEDIRTLLSKELDLLWLELREKITQSTSLLAFLVVLGSLTILSLQLLVIAGVFFIAKTFQLELYASFALTGAATLLVTALGAAAAWFGFRELFSKPLETPTMMKEHWQWILQKKN